MNSYKLGYLLLAIVSLVLILAYAFSYDVFQALKIGKTTYFMGLVDILVVIVFVGAVLYIRESKHNEIIYKQEKQHKIDSIRRQLKKSDLKDEEIKDRIDFLEKQNLTKIEEIEEKLQEKIDKNRKDEVNEYNFFNSILKE